MTLARALFILGLVIVLALIAGAVPLAMDGVDSRAEAVKTGLASQAILKALIAGGAEAVKPPPAA